MTATLDKTKFEKLDNTNIYISDKKLLSVHICKYTSLFNLLMILSNEYYIGSKKYFPDKLESGDCYLTFAEDFEIADRPHSIEKQERIKQIREDVKKTTDWLTSCWTLKTEEDYFMWRTYAPDPHSVKIDTTLSHLLNSLELSNYEVYISKMNYQPRRHVLQDLTQYAFYKYSYYKGEEEIRLYFLPLTSQEKTTSVHLNIIDLSQLITGITLSPFLPPTSRNKLREFLIKKYNVKKDLIMYSNINEYNK